jgi:hypothetical protein
VLVVALAGVPAAGAQALDFEVSVADGVPTITWVQPADYPASFVDLVEIADSPDTDEDGYFLYQHLVDDAFYLEAAESTGTWTSWRPPLEPGTYHAHLRLVTIAGDSEVIAWSGTKPFTVVGGASEPAPTTGGQDPGPASPGGDAAVHPVPITYETQVQRRQARGGGSRVAVGDVLTLSARATNQPDTATSRYRVCWTRGRRLECLRRTITGTVWDRVELTVTAELGQRRRGRTTLHVIWQSGNRIVASRRYEISPSEE